MAKDITSYPRLHRMIPAVYREVRGQSVSMVSYIVWFIYNIYSSAITYYVTMHGYAHGNVGSSAAKGTKDNDLHTVMLCAFTIMTFTANFQLLFYTAHFTWFLTLFIFINWLLFFPLTIMLNNASADAVQSQTSWDAIMQFTFWLVVTIAILLNFLPLMAYTVITKFMKTPEMDKLNEAYLNRNKEEPHYSHTDEASPIKNELD
mmetsp:Transcript_8215/g.7626  ORF Transcript_8215/g.7626 Transcript_8215/m.7626 type:complete len:204 (+) Transcript_8215:2896-3507(+)